MSSAVEGFEVGAEAVVGLAGDVALEAAEDLASVEAVGGPFCRVGAGALAVAESADRDHVEGAIGLSIAAVVEAVAGGAAGAGWDRGGAADLGECCFAAEAIDVLAGGDEELACALGADSEELKRARRCEVHESLELTVELDELTLELADATGEAAQRELCRLRGFVDPFGVGAQL
jgi:hypothetical protein